VEDIIILSSRVSSGGVRHHPVGKGYIWRRRVSSSRGLYHLKRGMGCRVRVLPTGGECQMEEESIIWRKRVSTGHLVEEGII
jgi:hypothetical protein